MPPRVEITREYLFARRRITDSGCWEWTECVDAHGYGACTIGQKIFKVHRAAYTLLVDPNLPKGAPVLHRCDNTICFRPDHLYRGTKKQNSADMMSRGRGKAQFQRRTRVAAFDERCRDLRIQGCSHEMIGSWLNCGPMTAWSATRGMP